MDTKFYDGYKGPISAASAAVIANYTVVDMFASVVYRQCNAGGGGEAGRARQAERYYRNA